MPRSRSGCTTCKKRHRKCDEAKPTCLECQKNKLRCEGYAIKLKWDIGVASRGRLKGASLPVLASVNDEITSKEQGSLEEDNTSRPSGQSHITHTLGKANGSFEDIGPVLSTPDVQMNVKFSSISGGLQEPQWLENRSDQEKELFRQCIQQTIFHFYSTSTLDSFCTELKRLALQAEPLYLSLIATHLYTTNPRNPPPLFHDLCNQSLCLFREQLSRFDGTLDAGLINAGIFLCTLYLFQGIPWTNQLNHMMWVYGLFPGAENAHRIADMEYRFSLESMAIMDIPTFVRGREAPTLGIWSHLRSAQEVSPIGLADGIESVTGLPRSLLDIFACIRDASAEAAFTAWPGHRGSVPHCHLWEAFRLSGILLSRRQRRVAGPRSPPNEVLMCRLVAALDALYETRHRQEYRPGWGIYLHLSTDTQGR